MLLHDRFLMCVARLSIENLMPCHAVLMRPSSNGFRYVGADNPEGDSSSIALLQRVSVSDKQQKQWKRRDAINLEKVKIQPKTPVP